MLNRIDFITHYDAIEKTKKMNKIIEDKCKKYEDKPQYKLNVVVSFKVSTDDYALLQEKAMKEGFNVSKFIRYCLFVDGYIYSYK